MKSKICKWVKAITFGLVCFGGCVCCCGADKCCKAQNMPITNKQLHQEMLDMKQDLRDIKGRLLDPDTGTISKVNRNTSFRKVAQKTLWSIWIILIGILSKLTFWN